MSDVVLSDAQMGMFRVLKPMLNFEAVYQGVAGTVPIAFPGALDPQAGSTGFLANLMAGLSMPLGGRALIQIPMTIDHYVPMADYQYQIIWRTRNQATAAVAIAAGREISAYHLPSEEAGRNETQINPNSKLVFIPGASDVEVFEQAEPGSGAATLDVRQQRYVPQIISSWVQPLTPAGAPGIWQQGAYQFSSNVECAGPSWLPIWLDVSGDEMMILAYKVNSDVPWDFTTVDKSFSNTYGTNAGAIPNDPNIGIIVSTGTMGS